MLFFRFLFYRFLREQLVAFTALFFSLASQS